MKHPGKVDKPKRPRKVGRLLKRAKELDQHVQEDEELVQVIAHKLDLRPGEEQALGFFSRIDEEIEKALAQHSDYPLAVQVTLSYEDWEIVRKALHEVALWLRDGTRDGPRDTFQLAKQVGVGLMRIYKQVHGLQRARKDRQRIALRAIEVLKQHQPELGDLITEDDLISFNGHITPWVEDYVSKLIPDAKALMQDLGPRTRRMGLKASA